MSNFLASNLLAAQANLINKFAAGELRYREPVAWKSLLDQQPIATPDYKSLKTREDRDLQLNYFLRQQAALGTARAANPTGTSGDSQIMIPAFASRVAPAKHISIKQMDNNMRSFQEAFNINVLNSALNLIEGLNVEAENFIFANRSGVNNAVNANGVFNVVNDVFEVAETDKNTFAQVIMSVLEINKYNASTLDIYCDTIAWQSFLFAMNQGDANKANLAYQFFDNSLRFIHSPNMNASAVALGYTKGFCVAVERGMAVALDWIPKQNREGVASPTIGGQAEYGSIINPIDGLNYATYKIWERGDFQTVNGKRQDVRETFELSIDRAFEHAPLSVANETPLLAFGLVTTPAAS